MVPAIRSRRFLTVALPHPAPFTDFTAYAPEASSCSRSVICIVRWLWRPFSP